MHYILTSYYPARKERKELVSDIIQKYESKSSYIYPITSQTSLLLSKDERRIRRIRKYKQTPFPLLSNLEIFSSLAGDWDPELQKYQIQSRQKTKPSSTSNAGLGSHLYLVKIDTLNTRGNKFLRRQYERLTQLRNNGEYTLYWKESWGLMQNSPIFRLASLNNWKPRWYKELSYEDLNDINNTLHSILSFNTTQTKIYNTWIESPKSKWRQLGIPPKGWRLYFHMLNIFISYLYEPTLNPKSYDGFIYNRGCKSWWENLLWDTTLTSYKHLLEVDLSSGFPNLSLHRVREALIISKRIPVNIVNLIITHLKSPLVESPTFPTFETYVENKENKNWRNSNRSVHMGLGISPILFVITLKHCFNQIPLLRQTENHFYLKSYADDLSLFFNTPWLIQYWKAAKADQFPWISHLLTGRNPIIEYFNQIPYLRDSGILFCKDKSSFVRLFGIWIKDYVSLGIKLYSRHSQWQQLNLVLNQRPIPLELQGYTRGRGANPLKGKASTLPSRTKLEYWSPTLEQCLNLQNLILKYKPYFGLLLSKLYTGNLPSQPRTRPKIPPNSLLGILHKAQINKYLLSRSDKLNIYNYSCKINELILFKIYKDPHPLLSLVPSLDRKLKLEWPPIERKILKEEVNNPLNEEKPFNNDLFIKYSALNLSDKKLKWYSTNYAKLNRQEAAAKLPKSKKR